MVNTWGTKGVVSTEIWTFAYRWVGHEILQQHCYMLQVTHKVKQINRLTKSSVKNNRTHTIEAANQFSDCRRTNSCPILNERVCEVIPQLWLSWPRTCMILEYVSHTCSVGLTLGEGHASPYILFLSRSVYSLTQQARHGRAFPSKTTKYWSTASV